MIKLIMSGGQNGVDVSALKAAVEKGIMVACHMPKCFKTLDGPRPEYVKLYNATENESSLYPPRTEANVLNSDGTLRIAKDFDSSGEKCTLKFIKKHHKPYFDVQIDDINSYSTDEDNSPAKVATWIIDEGIHVLNVAGNSEHTCKGIEEWAKRFVCAVIDEVGRQENDWLMECVYRLKNHFLESD